MKFLQIGLPCGSIWGIRIYLHFTLFLFLVIQIFNPIAPGIGFVGNLTIVIILYGSVLLHELGHCYGAIKVGGHAQQIILWPLGGLALVSGAEKDPQSDFIVTALGPLVSVALAVLGWVLFYAVLYLFPVQAMIPVLFFLKVTAYINTALALFNLLLPLFPMDSARLVRAILSFYYHPERITYYLCTGGLWIGGGLFFVSFMTPGYQMLGLIGLFGAFASYQERMRVQYQPVYLMDGWFYSPNNPGFPRWLFRELRALFKWKPKSKKKKATIVDIQQPPKPKTPLERMQQDMAEAVAREDYATAAKLRDKISRLKDS